MKNFFFKSKVFLRTLLTNRLFYLWAFVTAAFLASELWFGDDAVRVFAESGRIAVFLVLAVMTFRAAVHSFWSGAKLGAEQITVALFGLCTAILVHAIWVPLQKYGELATKGVPTAEITTAVIIAIALSGLGYLIPITVNRQSTIPVIGTWAGVFFAGLLAGALMTSMFLTGLRWWG